MGGIQSSFEGERGDLSSCALKVLGLLPGYGQAAMQRQRSQCVRVDVLLGGVTLRDGNLAARRLNMEQIHKRATLWE